LLLPNFLPYLKKIINKSIIINKKKNHPYTKTLLSTSSHHYQPALNQYIQPWPPMKKSKSNQPPLTHFFHSGWIILVFNVRPPFQPLLTSSPPPTTHSLDTSIIQPQHLQPMDSTRGPLVIFFSNYFLKSMLFYIVFFLSLFIFK